MFRGIREWIRFFLWPSLPYQLLEIVFPDRMETFYEGYDEIHINSSKGGYTITVIPRESREDSPGPITFISSHDPWSVGTLVTPFFVYRRLVIMWAIMWFIIIYNLFIFGFNILFTPPPRTVYIQGLGRVTIPDPTWRPDPILESWWIVALGFMTMYYIFHVLSFIKPTVKISTLITIGAVSGTYYVVPAPEPLTTVKVSDFLRLLGYKFYHFTLEVVSVLNGMVASLIRENKTLREQALSYDDAMSRTTQIDAMLKRFSATQVVARFMMTKPLLFMLLITIPFALGIFIGMALSGGVGVASSGGVNATTTAPHP